MNIETRMNGITENWQFYKVYRNYHAAFCEIGLVKNQGFAGAIIRDMKNGRYTIFTINFKGAKV